jgi:transcriptional regulator with XRE-family HTH domain
MRSKFRSPILFGDWLADIREQRNLTLQQIADLSGLQTGTISRIERVRVSASLSNALRICNVLGISPYMLYKALEMPKVSENLPDWTPSIHYRFPRNQDLPPPPAERESLLAAYEKHVKLFRDPTQEASVVTVRDVQHFLQLIAEHPEQAQALLTEMLSRLVAAQHLQGQTAPIRPTDASRLLNPLPFYSCDVPYPNPTTENLKKVYAAGGIAIAEDANHFSRRALRELKTRVEYIPRDLKDTLNRLSATKQEFVLLNTVLEVDVFLNQQGFLLEQFWFAHQMREEAEFQRLGHWRAGPPSDMWKLTDLRHIRLFVTLYRWLDLSGETDASWIRQFFFGS